jgi:hypothetical protein
MIFYLFVIPIISVLIIMIVPLIVKFIKFGHLFPSDVFLLGLFEYDSLLGYNISKNFKTKNLWNGSEKVKNNLGKFHKGMDKIVTINTERYRGNLHSTKKANGIYRIIVIGDSLAYCTQNDDNYTWPALLEKELNNNYSRNKKFEVINFGVGGYNLYQSAMRYQRDYSDYEPDLLLNASFIIDWKYSRYAEKIFSRTNKDPFKCKTKMKRYLYQLFLLSPPYYIFSKLQKISVNYQIKEKENYFININKYRENYLSDNYWIKAYTNNFEKLYKLIKSKSSSAKIYSISFPVLMSTAEFYINPNNTNLPNSLMLNIPRGYNYKDPIIIEHHKKYLAHSYLFNEFLVDLSNKYNDCGTISSFDTINKYPLENRDKIFVDDFHLNNKGSCLFAKDISKYLIDNVIN